MEAKKSPQANLEKKKSIFLQAGIILTMLCVLVAFEWKQYERPNIKLQELSDIFYDIEDIPIMHREEPEPPEPPPSQEIDIVDDEKEIDDFVDIDVDATATTVVEPFIPVIPKVVEPEVPEGYIFVAADVMPEFPGGLSEMFRYIGESLNYPELAKQTDISGTVSLTFVVEPDGSITNVTLLRGIGGGCDEEAIRVIKSMPKWNPGLQRGEPVRVRFSIPVTYRLN